MTQNKKSKQNKIAKVHDKKVGELITLAHQGTEAGLKKITEFTATTKDKNLKAMAEIAKEESEYFYYSPTNEQEEKDLLLAKIIRGKEDRLIMDLECRAEAAKFELEKLDIQQDVHKKLLKTLSKDRQKDWQYNFSEDYYQTVVSRLQEIEDEIDYEAKWLEVAKKSIKTKKYCNLPLDFFQHYHWDYEDVNFWSDNSLADLPDEPEEASF